MAINLHPRRRAGFTLIEVLVATLILGITIGAVSSVIRTGMKAWRTGHGASEVGQTVRITQDVVLRDLDNIFYQTESSYNNAFRAQTAALAAKFGADFRNNRDLRALQDMIQGALGGGKSTRHHGSSRNQDGQQDAFDDLGLDNIAPPLNLSFHGTEGKLSFARSYRARFPGDQDTWGLRRVTYYVRDKILYRKEQDPFGLRMTEGDLLDTQQNRQNNMGMQQQQDDPIRMIQNQLLRLFILPEDNDDKNAATGETTAGDAAQPKDAAAAPASKLMPTQVCLEEPLCAGVEIFKIKYGFFQDGAWTEDQNWDSQGYQHRSPPPDETNLPGGAPAMGMPTNGFVPMMMGSPDDLPGYISIQIAMRMPDGKGRLYSFTIYHSLPGATETDVLRDNPQGNGMGYNSPRNFPRHGGPR